MRFHFLRIEGEHLLHVNWPLQTANGLQCHTAHANWPLQTANSLQCHTAHANWPLQTANGLQCHTAHANWPLQIAIITDRAVCNAIQPVRRCASTITKKHATLNPERDTLKSGELDDEASPTFLKKHMADKYGGEPYKGREI